jgi:hypothetical protein
MSPRTVGHAHPPHHVEAAQLLLPVAIAQIGGLLGVARRCGGARAVVEALALGLSDLGDAQAVRTARRRQLAPLRDGPVVGRPGPRATGPIVRAEVAVVVQRHPPSTRR